MMRPRRGSISNKLAVVGLLVLVIAVGARAFWDWRASRLAPANQPRPQVTQVEPIRPLGYGLYLVSGGGCNTAVFVTESGVLLVDTKYAESWDALVAEVRTVTAKPITHVVNTHSHLDHTEGNSRLPHGVRVVVHERTAANLREMAIANRRADPWLGTHPTTVTDRLTLFDGAEAVDLYHFGPAHTGGDMFVVFRAARVLHPGDVFPSKALPVINLESGGNGESFHTVVTKAASLPDIDRVITSHGPVVPWDDFVAFADLNRRLFEHVRTHMHFGADKVKVFRSFDFPKQFESFDQTRAFDTMDEVDRSLRPWWQRVW